MTTSAQALALAEAALAGGLGPPDDWHISQADGGSYLIGFNPATLSKCYIITSPTFSYGGAPYLDRSLLGYELVFAYDTCSLPLVLNATGIACVLPPEDYVCSLPREWVQTIEGDWRCAVVATIPPASGDNQYGISGTEGDYHTEAYPDNLHCDPLNEYLCIPTGFWRDLIVATQTETLP